MRQLKGAHFDCARWFWHLEVVVRLHVTKTVRRQTYPALVSQPFLVIFGHVILGEDEPAVNGMELSRDP